MGQVRARRFAAVVAVATVAAATFGAVASATTTPSVTTTPTIVEVGGLAPGGRPTWIANSGGFLWVTETAANDIARITTSGAVTTYPVPTTPAGLTGITAGPNGNVWFVESTASQVGQITPNGVVTEYPLASGSDPLRIVTGLDADVVGGRDLAQLR